LGHASGTGAQASDKRHSVHLLPELQRVVLGEGLGGGVFQVLL